MQKKIRENKTNFDFRFLKMTSIYRFVKNSSANHKNAEQRLKTKICSVKYLSICTRWGHYGVHGNLWTPRKIRLLPVLAFIFVSKKPPLTCSFAFIFICERNNILIPLGNCLLPIAAPSNAF